MINEDCARYAGAASGRPPFVSILRAQSAKPLYFDVFGFFWKSDNVVNFGDWEFSQLTWIDPSRFDDEREALLVGYDHWHPEMYPARNPISMFQALHVCNSHDYSGYDVVIRSRTDFGLNRSFEFETLDLTKLHQPQQALDHLMIDNDQFGFASPEVMRVYFDGLSSISAFLAEGRKLGGEEVLDFHLIRNGFTPSDMAVHDMNHLFPPRGYDGHPNSLIRDDFVAWRGVDILKRQRRTKWQKLKAKVAKALLKR